MKNLKLPELSLDSFKKFGVKTFHALHSFQVIIISSLVLVLLGYATIEVSQAANTSITPEQEAQKQAELAASKIEFDQETIDEIQRRLDEDIEVQPQDLGTDNPFRFNN